MEGRGGKGREGKGRVCKQTTVNTNRGSHPRQRTGRSGVGRSQTWQCMGIRGEGEGGIREGE